MTARPPPDPRFPEDGSLVGAWLVQERIGSGNHGVVFRVVHADRPEGASYALKLAREPEDARFEREAWLLSRLRHPAVPRFEDQGLWTSARGRHYPYLVMQWVEGVPLYDWATVHGLTLRQAIGLLAQVARALEATHRHGVHRDVKGGNVRVTPDGRVVLLDFGSCWYPEAIPLTDGMPPGTRPYRSPGQLLFEYALRLGARHYYEGEPEDDVYALGVTAYRLLASTYPPSDTDPLPPRGVAECCPELSALVLRMLSEDPLARGSARKVAEELERLFRQANPLLDGAWIEPSSMLPTEKARRPAPRRSVLGALSPLLAFAAVLAALMLLVLLPQRSGSVKQNPVAYEEPRNKPKGGDNPDAGTVGTGDSALASAAPSSEMPVSGRGVAARDVTDRPFKGQKRPPCSKQGEVEIKGNCWAPQKGYKAPCAVNWYEHEGFCYLPVILPQPDPTSEEPK